jgi:predicted ester cyclase
VSFAGQVLTYRRRESPEDRKLYVRRLYEDTFTDRAVPVKDAPQVPAALQRFFSTFHAAFAEARATVDEMEVAENSITAHLTLSGTHTGEYEGIPPGGRRVITTAVVTHRFSQAGNIETVDCRVDDGVLRKQLLD